MPLPSLIDFSAISISAFRRHKRAAILFSRVGNRNFELGPSSSVFFKTKTFLSKALVRKPMLDIIMLDTS